MKYAYHDLSAPQFERLVVALCQRLLGVAVHGFATGPDGGRDARFVGTAELHPSTTAPWIGTVIVQAKHTNGFNRSFSESDFYSEAQDDHIVGKEVPRISALRQGGKLDHYMLFSNRRLTALAEDKIETHISVNCNIPKGSIYLCGLEQLELWLSRFGDVAGLVDLNPIDAPLIVKSDDLAEIVEAFARNHRQIADAIVQAPTERVAYEQKNRENNMTEEYAKAQRRNYLKDAAQIGAFLAAPENDRLLQLYQVAVEEFELKIIARRRDFDCFDDLMNYLADLLYDRDAVLRQLTHKRLTRAMLFYMYFNCDIGRIEDAATH